MAPRYVIGVDGGTESLRAGVFDTQGAFAQHARSSPAIAQARAGGGGVCARLSWAASLLKCDCGTPCPRRSAPGVCQQPLPHAVPRAVMGRAAPRRLVDGDGCSRAWGPCAVGCSARRHSCAVRGYDLLHCGCPGRHGRAPAAGAAVDGHAKRCAGRRGCSQRRTRVEGQQRRCWARVRRVDGKLGVPDDVWMACGCRNPHGWWLNGSGWYRTGGCLSQQQYGSALAITQQRMHMFTGSLHVCLDHRCPRRGGSSKWSQTSTTAHVGSASTRCTCQTPPWTCTLLGVTGTGRPHGRRCAWVPPRPLLYCAQSLAAL